MLCPQAKNHFELRIGQDWGSELPACATLAFFVKNIYDNSTPRQWQAAIPKFQEHNSRSPRASSFLPHGWGFSGDPRMRILHSPYEFLCACMNVWCACMYMSVHGKGSITSSSIAFQLVFLICVCMCMYVRAHVFMCVIMGICAIHGRSMCRSEDSLGCQSSCTVFGRVSGAGLCVARSAGLMASGVLYLLSHFRSSGVINILYGVWLLYMGSGNPNSAPNACVADSSPTGPSPCSTLVLVQSIFLNLALADLARITD